VAMQQSDALKDRLALYRTLLRRDGAVPELGRLVALLEAELGGGDSAGDAPALERASR
jgi:hypothetical protein